MVKKNRIPRLVIIYGVIQTLIAFYFGVRFLLDGDLSESFNAPWFLGARNMAVVAVLVLGLLTRNPAILLSGYLSRFVIDAFDVINEVVAAPTPLESFLVGAVFILFSLIPLAWGMIILWRLVKEE